MSNFSPCDNVDRKFYFSELILKKYPHSLLYILFEQKKSGNNIDIFNESIILENIDEETLVFVQKCLLEDFYYDVLMKFQPGYVHDNGITPCGMKTILYGVEIDRQYFKFIQKLHQKLNYLYIESNFYIKIGKKNTIVVRLQDLISFDDEMQKSLIHIKFNIQFYDFTEFEKFGGKIMTHEKKNNTIDINSIICGPLDCKLCTYCCFPNVIDFEILTCVHNYISEGCIGSQKINNNLSLIMTDDKQFIFTYHTICEGCQNIQSYDIITIKNNLRAEKIYLSNCVYTHELSHRYDKHDKNIVENCNLSYMINNNYKKYKYFEEMLDFIS